MIELLYTTIVLFVVFIPLYYYFQKFKSMKMFLVLFQFLLAIILLSNNFYKNHSLYDLPKINYIQKTDFKPIESFSNRCCSFETLSNTEFSIIKTEKYSKKCIENYYIENNNPCPVTDIAFIEERNDECIVYNKVEIGGNEHFYYSNNYKSGKLYKSFNYYDLVKLLEKKKIKYQILL